MNPSEKLQAAYDEFQKRVILSVAEYEPLVLPDNLEKLVTFEEFSKVVESATRADVTDKLDHAAEFIVDRGFEDIFLSDGYVSESAEAARIILIWSLSDAIRFAQ